MVQPPAPRSTGYDAELQLHNEVLRRVADVQPYDDVLDIGCGTGHTTRQAAQVARSGSALGVDVSAASVQRSRDLTRASGIHNVTFEHADAQVHRFQSQHFNLAISRFGTMFFDDPQVAFANIGRALRPSGRLVTIVWQSHERNEWAVAIRRALEAAGGRFRSTPVWARCFPSATRRQSGRSWRLQASPTSASPTWKSRSTTGGTLPQRWIGFAASPRRATS